MASNRDSTNATCEYNAYVDDDGTFVLEFLEESTNGDVEEEAVPINDIDPENLALVEFRSLLFDTMYHQLDIREWVI